MDRRILIVDNSEMNRSILADILEEEYEILEAEDGVEAVSILRSRRGSIALVLLDMIMPRLDGFGVLEAMNQNGWVQDMPVIMIWAENGSDEMARAYDMGVTDFITRPFDALVVRRRVKNALLLYAKQKRLMDMVKKQIRETERQSRLIINILSQIVEFRSVRGGRHILNVQTITELLLRALMRRTDKYGLSDDEINRISVGSALHDIGKLVIDEDILNKPGKLTAEEFGVIKTHAIKGTQILDTLEAYRNDPLIKAAYEICRWHHERYDGSGYPDGLKGDEIPISAQVVALADVYDTLTGLRVYRPPFSHEKALEMIMSGQCGAFNPLLLECLAENSDSIRRETAVASEENLACQESWCIVKESVRKMTGNGLATDRTLQLMDNERMKYRFFSSLTQDIQFEYSFSPPMLRLSEDGAQILGLDEIIPDPADSLDLRAVLEKGGWKRISEKIRQTTPDEPDTNYVCQLTGGGKTRWYRLVLRTVWTGDTPPRLAKAMGKAIDIQDTYEKISALENKASLDAMTGLFNRASAMERIEAQLRRKPNSHYAMGIFDLDRFKSANDVYGHQFGDRVLKEVAHRLASSVRSSDIICRAGGDEFMFFLEYKTDLEKAIDRIFHSLCGSFEDYSISVTMGIVRAETAGCSGEGLFRAADTALYAAKRAGRRQYRFYDSSMQDVLTAISDIDEESGGR